MNGCSIEKDFAECRVSKIIKVILEEHSIVIPVHPRCRTKMVEQVRFRRKADPSEPNRIRQGQRKVASHGVRTLGLGGESGIETSALTKIE